MRRVFVAGNWKMNLDRASSRKLTESLKAAAGAETRIDVAVCPPFVYLSETAAQAKGSRLMVGAQDCWFEEKGAFTGEISPAMLLDVGCSWVIVGHSERRHVIGETDDLIARKAKAALAAGLKVILCVGELLDDRKAGRTHDVVKTQVVKGLFDLTGESMARVTIAYEPVWAIGTGLNASPEDAGDVHGFIRGLIAGKFGEAAAENTTIQYGGSVKPENAAELMGCPQIDGFLVGGASLKAEPFLAIVRAAIDAAEHSRRA